MHVNAIRKVDKYSYTNAPCNSILYKANIYSDFTVTVAPQKKLLSRAAHLSSLKECKLILV